ncbi:HAD family phosphatase [Ensifer sp.]|jgi:HAD superfamily hydrolase (TIGR01509 family)|uniref:HAD family hydrolase n=1 Tax=Ensifer sp. TaxID=1872086 RepID=UPI002E14B995|nr:HAD family phosphatase [Ensifer sp.]
MPDVGPTDIRLPLKPLAVVFDMDGLLFDTEALYRDAMIQTAAELGHDMPASLYLDTIGLSGEATRTLLSGRYGDAFDLDRFWKSASARFAAMATTETRLKPGVVDLLDLLDGMGLPFAIATSSQHHDVQRNLDGHGLRDRFPTVVAYGDYDNGKPHPAPFLAAARRLGVAPEHCLALEDSHNGVRSASSAGMMTVMVPDLLPSTEEMRALCVGIASSLHEIGAALQEKRA